MVVKAARVNQGDLTVGQEGVHACVIKEPKSRATGRSQSALVAKKLRNGSGVKGAQEGGRRERQTSGKKTSGSASKGYTSWRSARPLGVDRTDGLDGADADGPRDRGERRPMVQRDG